MRIRRVTWACMRIAAAAAMCCSLFSAPAVATADPWQGEMLSDAIVSWWSRPNAVYQPYHGITYMTGVSSTGDWVWGAYDHKSGVNTRRVLGRSRSDDHNTPAIHAPTDKPPIVFYTGHNTTSVIWVRTSRKVGDWLPGPERALPMPGPVTYVQVHQGRTPDTLLLLTRCGRDWLLGISSDYGESWVIRPLMRFELGAFGYLTTTQLEDGTIRLCAAGHPAKSDMTAVYYSEIDPLGDIRGADGAVLANIYDGAGLPLAAPRDLTQIHEYPTGGRARLFEVSKAPNPEVVLAEWVGDLEAEYLYLSRDESGWRSTKLVPTGRPIGYDYSTRYLGGATFPSPTDGGELYLSRETSGTWQIERWSAEQDQWTSSPVTTSTHILARPSAPLGASPELPLLWLDLRAYADYTKFSGSTYALLPEGKPRPGAVGTPVSGDWDGDGKSEPGVFRAGIWTLSDGGNPPIRFRFGAKGDRPLVGDWDGDGRDEIGLVRGREWILASALAPASVYRRFTYGRTGDQAVTGDWDGDGIDGIGVRRGADWFLKNDTAAGAADYRFTYGLTGDVAVAGDWTGSGRDGIGVKRGRTWSLRSDPSAGAPDLRLSYGTASDEPVVGDWGGLGRDTLGVRRGSTGVWLVIDSAPGLPRLDFAPNRLGF